MEEKTKLLGHSQVNRSERKANHAKRDRLWSRGLYSTEPAVRRGKVLGGAAWGVGAWGLIRVRGKAGYVGRIIDPGENLKKCCTIWNTRTVRKFNKKS